MSETKEVVLDMLLDSRRDTMASARHAKRMGAALGLRALVRVARRTHRHYMTVLRAPCL